MPVVRHPLLLPVPPPALLHLCQLKILAPGISEKGVVVEQDACSSAGAVAAQVFIDEFKLWGVWCCHALRVYPHPPPPGTPYPLHTPHTHALLTPCRIPRSA